MCVVDRAPRDLILGYIAALATGNPDAAMDR